MNKAKALPGSKVANANYANAYPGSNALPAVDHAECTHGASAKAVRECTIEYWKPIVEANQAQSKIMDL